MATKKSKKNINIITLGCSKNLVDSEQLMGQLDAARFKLVDDPNKAGTVIINTCGFIHDAKQESIETILEYAEAKEDGLIENLYVMGCLSQRYKEDLRAEIPEVDSYFGVDQLEDITARMGFETKKDLLGERVLTTPSHYAYLKISEGCDRKCAFCSIPGIRGPHKSKSIEDILKEAESLASKGVKELILIAQDLSYYGLDIYREQKLKELLSQLVSISGIKWIRLHYAFPHNFPNEILPFMAAEPKICNYMDIPLQHINNNVLKLMRRGADGKQTRALVDRMRHEVPNLALRTTMLVGHPGEGEKEFNELIDFVESSRFDRLGVFEYSHEEDTYGYKNYSDDIPPEVKAERAERIMDLQSGISLELNKAKEGKTYRVIIDRMEGEYYVGRTEYDSPEVDNEVLIKSERTDLLIGDIYDIKITKAEEYDLYGEPV